MPDSRKQRANRLKKMLLDRKRRLWMELRDELFRKLGKEYNAQFENPNDFEEMGLIDVVENTGLSVADVKRQELEGMDSAIERIEAGLYGQCEDCMEEIDEERLKAVPYATRCVKCQGASEGRS